MKPSREDFPDFNGRKGHYTITCFVICDHKQRIRYYHSGWPGNVHDERVFRTTTIAKAPEKHFSTNQYILSDSALVARDTVVPQFKKNYNATDLAEDKQHFNTICAAPRVIVEHCIGTWKERFPFLRNIRMRITHDPNTMIRIQRYVRATVILHNLMVGYDDEYVDQDNITNDERNTSLLLQPLRPMNEDGVGDERRIKLQNYLAARDVYAVVIANKY